MTPEFLSHQSERRLAQQLGPQSAMFTEVLGFERLAPLLPFWQGLRLLGQVFGEPGQPLWQPLAMGILLWAAAILAWFGKGGRPCATS